MELKNAVAVCLISLFSATLVVLIARSLDSQAASRLEPQLASIVEELQAMRKQGGIAASPGTADQRPRRSPTVWSSTTSTATSAARPASRLNRRPRRRFKRTSPRS